MSRSEKRKQFLSTTRYGFREAVAGLLVVGGAGILEYFKVFGDGGPTSQIIWSSIVLAAGIVAAYYYWENLRSRGPVRRA